jgi:hypothetical protein
MKNFFKQSDFSPEILHSGRYVTPGVMCYFDVILSGEHKAAYNKINGDIIYPSVIQRGSPLSLDNRYKKSITLEGINPEIQYDSAIYLPIPFEGSDHFGHLITEIIGLLYALRSYITIPLDTPLLVGEKEWNRVAKIHDFLNCNFNIKVIANGTDDISVNKLLIPTPTMHNRHSVSPFHTTALQLLLPEVLNLDFNNLLTEVNPKLMPNKIYLSRSRMPDTKRKIINENKLEKELEKKGWSILHPQEISLKEQLQHLYYATNIAGTAGSAFHLLMYFNPEIVQKKEIRCITHARIHLLNYILQFDMQKIEASYAIILEVDKNCKKASVNSDLFFPEESFEELKHWILNKN